MKNKRMIAAAIVIIAAVVFAVTGVDLMNGTAPDAPSDSYVTETPEETVTTEEVSLSEETAEETTSAETTEKMTEPSSEKETESSYAEYHFRNSKLLKQHFEKHGGEFSDMGYSTPEEYEKGASDVINDPNALRKTEAEDGDYVYYLEDTNEFVILSTDGYIRTYFRPDAGMDYYDRQ